MNLHLDLKRRDSSDTSFYDILGIDAAGVARVAQEQGGLGVKRLVSSIIEAKLPTTMYNFEVTNWEFR